jgi:phosphate transport system substrate-binding protein
MHLRLLALPALAGLALAACGSSTDGGSGSTSANAAATSAGSSICATGAAKPGYANGIAAISGGAKSVSGAGSTFVNPLMSVWADAYNKEQGVQVAYQSVGSGAGIKQIQAGTVDFGDSDAYMQNSEIAAAKGPIVQIPLTLGPVVVTYNLPGAQKGVHFDGETLGKIFAGKITAWNDPAITALNPGMNLPDTPIAVAHRSDGSGTTDIFTDYLSKESPTWVSTLGGATKSRGKTVAWPVGIGGKGNEGVSGAVNQTPGAIGYVELGYAMQQNLPYGDVKNKAGSFIEPCSATVSAATEGVQYPDDLRVDLTDAPGKEAYPITGTTWALVYQNQTDAAKAAALVNFFSWVLTKGQDLAPSVNYTPLGKDLQALCIAQLKKLTLNGQPLAK